MQSSISDPSAVGDDLSIELLRGVAACLVMFTHYQAMAGLDENILSFGFTGVDLFFVISGFVFAPYLLGKKLNPAGFFIRRLFRIYPLYLVALAAYAAYGHAHGKPLDHLITHILFLHTTHSVDIAFYYNAAFWSLPPEIEFYLALPLFCLLIPPPYRVPGLLACALGTHFTINWLNMTEDTAKGAVILQFHLPKLLLEFMLGVVARQFTLKPVAPLTRALCIVLGCALWLMLSYQFKNGGNDMIDASWWLRGNIGLLSASAYSLLIIGTAGRASGSPRFLVHFSQGWGNLSYGIYLFHNLTPELLSSIKPQLSAGTYVFVCILVTLLTAFLLHHLCERPFRRFGRALGTALEQACPPKSKS